MKLTPLLEAAEDLKLLKRIEKKNIFESILISFVAQPEWTLNRKLQKFPEKKKKKTEKAAANNLLCQKHND